MSKLTFGDTAVQESRKAGLRVNGGLVQMDRGEAEVTCDKGCLRLDVEGSYGFLVPCVNYCVQISYPQEQISMQVEHGHVTKFERSLKARQTLEHALQGYSLRN